MLKANSEKHETNMNEKGIIEQLGKMEFAEKQQEEDSEGEEKMEVEPTNPLKEFKDKINDIL